MSNLRPDVTEADEYFNPDDSYEIWVEENIEDTFYEVANDFLGEEGDFLREYIFTHSNESSFRNLIDQLTEKWEKSREGKEYLEWKYEEQK